VSEPRWVASDADLQGVIDILRSEEEYGLDTEFVAERSYWPQLCLVQLSWPGGVALVDPFACDVGALADLLATPSTMITHAGASDLPIIERACGARPQRLFDTQLAAGFVGLGMPSLVSLVSGLLDTRLDKSEQLADWTRRPLPEATRLYAAGDVAHLHALTAKLRERLDERGRRAWADAECEALRTAPNRDQDPDTAWWRIKGARSLRGERAQIAQSVAAWRERRARELDRPARFVLGDLVLAGIAARAPKSTNDLTKMRGAGSLPQGVVRAVLEAVELGRAMPKSELRQPPKHAGDDPALDAAAALLAAWTGQVAGAEGVEARVLATRDDVRALVNGRPGRLDSGWRAEMVGDRLRHLMSGEAVLRLVDGGRRVEIVERGEWT
jgi:ribonuclease D